MTDIVIFGEVMIELAPLGDGNFALGVAGDTYNTACTMQGLGINVTYLTSLGSGHPSNMVRSDAEAHGVTLLEPGIDQFHSPGLYMINNDAAGERSFSYWRNDSAAKALFSDGQALKGLLNQAIDSPACYFSGITLALMSVECRAILLEFLALYRNQGGRVLFDPNYRPALWDKTTAATEIKSIQKQVDVYLPGFEEEALLFGFTSVEANIAQLLKMPNSETVIKNGPQSCTLLYEQQTIEVSVAPSQSVIDTTGAGDTFNGGYIAARLLGLKPEAAISFAAVAASQVLSIKGGVLQTEQLAELKAKLDHATASPST